MKKIQIAQVDAFTTEIFGGNPAGVVLDANILTDDEMQKIANEMNLSETAFVLKSNKADFKLRYFTPTSEIKFCGHATVGTLYALAQNNMYGMNVNKLYDFNVETAVGILKMAIQKNDEIIITFNAPTILLKKSSITHGQLAAALKVPIHIFDTVKPIMIEETNQTLYATIKSLKILGEIKYDYQETKKFSEENNIVLITLLTPETYDPKKTVHVRLFAPAVGLAEHPVPGAIQGGLAGYLIKNKMVTKQTKYIYSEQGHFVNRPGSLKIEVDSVNSQITARIIAQAVMVFQTEIFL